MPARSEQFLLLDRMRKAAGVSPQRAVAGAGMTWLRYLNLRFGLDEPTAAELRGFERAVSASSLLSLSHSRTVRTSPSVERAGTAAHGIGVPLLPAPPVNSREG